MRYGRKEVLAATVLVAWAKVETMENNTKVVFGDLEEKEIEALEALTAPMVHCSCHIRGGRGNAYVGPDCVANLDGISDDVRQGVLAAIKGANICYIGEDASKAITRLQQRARQCYANHAIGGEHIMTKKGFAAFFKEFGAIKEEYMRVTSGIADEYPERVATQLACLRQYFAEVMPGKEDELTAKVAAGLPSPTKFRDSFGMDIHFLRTPEENILAEESEELIAEYRSALRKDLLRSIREACGGVAAEAFDELGALYGRTYAADRDGFFSAAKSDTTLTRVIGTLKEKTFFNSPEMEELITRCEEARATLADASTLLYYLEGCLGQAFRIADNCNQPLSLDGKPGSKIPSLKDCGVTYAILQVA